MARGTQFSVKYRFKWTQTAGEINFMTFKEGIHICNHFSNSKVFTDKIQTLEILEILHRSLKNKEVTSEFYQGIEDFNPVTFRLDMVSDLIQFLQNEDKGLWLVKNSRSNMGRGIEMISDISAYKERLLTKQDKWGDSAVDKSNVKELIEETKITDAAEERLKRVPEENKSVEEPKTPAPKKANLNSLVKVLKNMVIQKYIEDPLLIDNKKFDIRVLMVIVCCKPYFVYAHPGYVRKSLNDYSTESFAKTETSEDGKKSDWQSRYTHLTNLSIQKKHPEYDARKEESAMSMDQLCSYLVEKG